MAVKLKDVPYIPFYKRISYLYIPCLFVATTVLMDLLMYVVMGLAFPSLYIFSLTIILLIAGIVALVQIKWIQAVICSVFLGCQLFTTISNIIAYQTCGEIFSLETFKTLTTGLENADAVILDLWFLIPVILLLVGYIAALVLLLWFCRLPKNYRHFQNQSLMCGILVFISFFSYTFSYSSLPNYDRENYIDNLSNVKLMYDTFSRRVSNFQTFGTYSYYLDNLLSLIGGKADIVSLMELQVKENFTANEFALTQDEVLTKGDNLIMVLMETFERQAINPILMPNLFQFMQESCTEINGYYALERTCFTDHISQTGMHPDGKEFWNNYSDVSLPHSLANIFKRSGYVTSAFHDAGGNCYNRHSVFKKSIGFDKFICNTQYPHESVYAYNKDERLFTENLAKIAPANQDFYSYLISVSTHAINGKIHDLRSYYTEEFEYIEQAENWEKLIKMYPVLLSSDPIAVTTAKNYLAGACNFDKGFGNLIKYLKEQDDETEPGKKLIETTAIVMFGDHYYYANPNALKQENENVRDLAGNRCAFIVYNPHEKVKGTTQAQNALLNNPEKYGQTKNRFTSTMDIYPTVCSLFNIKTDKQLTYGRSIFDDDKSIGITYLGGDIFGAVGYTEREDAVDYINGGKYIDWQLWRTSDYKNYTGITLSNEDLMAITPAINRVRNSVYLNTKLYEEDMFKLLDKAKYELS